jgi:hypothetical protein
MYPYLYCVPLFSIYLRIIMNNNNNNNNNNNDK